jgi:hypothetical protein
MERHPTSVSLNKVFDEDSHDAETLQENGLAENNIGHNVYEVVYIDREV